MKFKSPLSLVEVASFLNAAYRGPKEHTVLGINEIHRVEKGDLVFVDHPKYYEKALQSAATTILINSPDVIIPDGKALIISDDPLRDFVRLGHFHQPLIPRARLIGTTSLIDPTTIVQPNVCIGEHVEIGKNCIIHSGVVIYDHVKIGDNCIIHSGTVIGADAFYFQRKGDTIRKLYSCGNVEIGNHVEIGASSTVDRGVSGTTSIGDYTKIDNQVHIGHDTEIGKRCIFAGGSAIAGCVNIEDDVTVWGQVGIKSDITVGKGAQILAQSLVTKNVPAGANLYGTPAIDFKSKQKEMARIRQLGKS